MGTIKYSETPFLHTRLSSGSYPGRGPWRQNPGNHEIIA